MHFILEAFNRRPLETKVVAYFRIATAIIFGILFIIYCGYLGSQIRYDKPLLRLSTENIQENYSIPQIEMCAQNTSMTIVRCDLMYMNWSSYPIPDCYTYIRVGNNTGETSSCYLFDAGDALQYGVQESPPPNSPYVRRLDVYWKADSLVNLTYASLGIPSIAIELYSPEFSRWDKGNVENMIPQQVQASRDMVLGSYRSTSMQNWTTAIFFTPTVYRAIRPNDVASLLGFEPEYVEIPTLDTKQLDWPMHGNINLTNGDYHGLFSVQLSKGSYDVKTEQRQHTLLAAVSLAGGAYGILTTLYVLLFGMVRLSPWGFVDQAPLVTARGIEKWYEVRERKKDDAARASKVRMQRLSAWLPFLRSRPRPLTNDSQEMHAMEDETKTDCPDLSQVEIHDGRLDFPWNGSEESITAEKRDEPMSTVELSPLARATNTEESTKGGIPMETIYELRAEHRRMTEKTNILERKLQDLETILSAYYLNMDRLEQYRELHRQHTLKKRSSRRRTTSPSSSSSSSSDSQSSSTRNLATSVP